MTSQNSFRSRKIQIQISDSLNHRLSNAAKESGVTKSAFVRVALEREFALEQQLALACASQFPSTKTKKKRTKNQL